jgi:lipopolysaccharide transport system ATP-binding protein
MSDVVIRAHGLGKKYYIGHEKRERYIALRDVLAKTARGLARSAMDMARGRQLIAGDEIEEFWALRDVSFEVSRGDVVGVIGRNGAGKSTLLKILSRITEPSEGRVEIKGRVASLLEVGTGFHPELTGRENIYLNGAILGMNRAEIRRKFDEIVEFAEVEKFLDTPVKHYSSGMYVRLAFAVAAHLEPEILVVDEVLAVGDAEFRQKCLGKMRQVSTESGRTCLFVSHNLSAILSICNKGILLQSGGILSAGQADQVCALYRAAPKTSRKRVGGSWLLDIGLRDSEEAPADSIVEGGELRFGVTVMVPERSFKLSLIIRNEHQVELVQLFDETFLAHSNEAEEVSFLVSGGNAPFFPGNYTVDIWLGDRFAKTLERLESVYEFQVLKEPSSKDVLSLKGLVHCRSDWRIAQ